MKPLLVLAAAGIWALTFLVGPLLPRALRRFWPWPEVLNGPWLQTLNAYLHALAGLVLWMLGLAATVKEFGDRYTEALMDPNGGTGDAAFLTWYGLIGFFAWMVSPLGLLSGLYLVDSVVRAVGGAMHRSVPGSLFVALPAALVGWGMRRFREAQTTRLYGPADGPDRIELRGATLFVRTTRARPEWHDLLTFSFEGRHYRLVWRGEVPDGARRCHEHRLEAWPDGLPIRRIVLLEGARASAAL